MRTHEIPQDRCSACGHPVDAATKLLGGATGPSAGDVTVCFECGHLMAFDADLSLRELTPLESGVVESDPRIVEIRRLIHERRANASRPTTH